MGVVLDGRNGGTHGRVESTVTVCIATTVSFESFISHHGP